MLNALRAVSFQCVYKYFFFLKKSPHKKFMQKVYINEREMVTATGDIYALIDFYPACFCCIHSFFAAMNFFLNLFRLFKSMLVEKWGKSSIIIIFANHRHGIWIKFSVRMCEYVEFLINNLA